jgi:hypothetical protein
MLFPMFQVGWEGSDVSASGATWSSDNDSTEADSDDLTKVEAYA